MRSTLDELVKELNDVRALVASIAPVNSALSGHPDSLVKQYVTIRRRFDNAAFTVALYASFEKFIENLVSAYARLEARRVHYTELPPRLLKKHIFRTAEILSRGRLGEGRYSDLRELDVVKNLFECLNGDRPYTLNHAAVVAHDSNLRATEVDTLFAEIGIEQICQRVRRSDALLEWYRSAKDLRETPQDAVPIGAIEERLKEIVERRNQVAHRGGNPDELLGSEKMSDAIDFIEAFSKSVFSVALGRYLEVNYAATSRGIQLRQLKNDGPYQKGKVVVVEKPTQRVFVGQPVFVLVDTIGARWGRIQNLKIDGTDVPSVEPEMAAPNGIGIALDFKCPTDAGLVALPLEDDVVWVQIEDEEVTVLTGFDDETSAIEVPSEPETDR